ncbi:hypothetical protein [Brevundimonas olei]|uniref:hypothetical protein n=1 Tax=Brevundimonas olei TaxID=657642 RepID=UPI0031D6EF7B
MIVTLNASQKLAISAFGTYANAIEPTLANLYQNSYFWIGQFSSDNVNYDINQVYFAFEGIGQEGKRIKSAKLLVAPLEIYGFNEVIVFDHDWPMSGAAFIKASQFSTLNEFGRTVFDQADGIPSMQAIDLDLPADFTGSLRVGLAPADQGRMNPSAADVTLVVNDARLEIEYEEAVSPIIIEAEASFELGSTSRASTVNRSVALASYELSGTSSAVTITKADANALFEPQGIAAAKAVISTSSYSLIALSVVARVVTVTNYQPLTPPPLERTVRVTKQNDTIKIQYPNGVVKVANHPHILRVSL